MKHKCLWRVELMKTYTKAIVVEAETWQEAGKLAECAHILEDPNFSYVDEGTWGMIESTPIEPVQWTQATKDFDISTHEALGRLHYLQVGDNVVTFDAGKKVFGLFRKTDPEVSEIKARDIVTQAQAEEVTEGKTLLKCGRCKEYGHGKDTCPQPPSKYAPKKEVAAYMAVCTDCGWEGPLATPLLDAVCPEGHIHLKKTT